MNQEEEIIEQRKGKMLLKKGLKANIWNNFKMYPISTTFLQPVVPLPIDITSPIPPIQTNIIVISEQTTYSIQYSPCYQMHTNK